MALFNLIARLSLDNTQFHAGLESSATAAERIGHRITHFFTKGFIALAGFHSLKSFVTESDRMVDSWFELNEQAKRFGREMDENVLRKLVEARIRMRHLKIDTSGPRSELQDFLGDLGSAAGAFGLFSEGVIAQVLSGLGLADPGIAKLYTSRKVQQASYPFSSTAQEELDREIQEEIDGLRKAYDDKHKEKIEESKPVREAGRHFGDTRSLSEDPLARIGGFSQFDAVRKSSDEQLTELKGIRKNTEGLNFNL